MQAMLGRLPTPEEYLKAWSRLDAAKSEVYRYMNFNEMADYVAESKRQRPTDVRQHN